MSDKTGSHRREFLRQAALAVTAAQSAAGQVAPTAKSRSIPSNVRTYTGDHLAMIAFPLGGVGAGSVSLGGRGQLRDWEIFNRPNKGYSPAYAFPSIWVQSGTSKPVARVLEAHILPPYEGQDGLGANNVPGLSRLASATFTGEYPMARVDFQDPALPVRVTLEAFSPFIPHDADESGHPVAVLRYRVTNAGRTPAQVAIAFSLDNPVKVAPDQGGAANPRSDARQNELRTEDGITSLVFTNPSLADDHPMRGDVALCALPPAGAKLTSWRGWPKSRWWNAPMLFWDDFSDDGELGPEPDPRGTVGSISLKQTIAPGASREFPFLLAWHFPNRTPEWCGWSAPKGHEKTIIGNYYTTRFPDAFTAARHVAQNLESLEKRTRLFVTSMRESTVPAVIKEAATANLSTLASTTCFRTADGEFHGFEGVNDKRGCCHGNCTHVWNYETATAHLFPTLARSLRKAAFGYSLDEAGAMHFRQQLPDGMGRSGYAAADGQMGQILHTYLDWRLSGDSDWLRGMWPKVKKAIEFSWVPGGWDADRDGVLEGVQHNTYDVEFYGPNPMCGIYYLGALRACEEMARAVGDTRSAAEYRRLFELGSKWTDGNLFNGEFYIQKVRGFRKDQIAGALRSDMGSEDTEKPEYQVGEGCLVDQLVGQYLAEVAGLGPLVSPEHIQSTLRSIYRYNYKRSLSNHDTVQRTFALNNEAAIVICDYGKAQRPRIPFPYYAEVMTGFEYAAAAHMIYAGMVSEGVECVGNIRARYDGKKRNPWDEAECGHHYARAMASWSSLLALSGFQYDAPRAAVVAVPRAKERPFRCFWSTATGWGTFSCGAGDFTLQVLAGKLPLQSYEVQAGRGATTASVQGKMIPHEPERNGDRVRFRFVEPMVLQEGSTLQLKVSA